MEFSILNLLAVLLVAWIAGRVASRFGYPSVLGELLAGIVLGPPMLGVLAAGDGLAVLAELGILLMMVYVGMEIDLKELKKASTGGFLAAIGGFITPFALCYAAIIWAGGTVLAAVFVGVAAGVTSLATKSRILVDLQLLDTRIAHMLMAGALIADTLSLVIFAAILGVAEAGTIEFGALGLVALKAVGFFVLATVVGLKGLPLLGRWLQRLQAGRTADFLLILIVALAFAEAAELAGMHGILGTFLAGLFLREGVLSRSQSKEVMHLVRDASIGFLAPIFFVTAGFAVSLDVFSTNLGLLLGVIVLATVGKIIGTALFYLPTGFGWREGLTIGAGMNGRGAVEIILAQIALSMGLISADIFSILVFMAIITTATVPVFLKWGVDWLRRRGELVRADDRQGTLIVGAGPTAVALGRLLKASQPVHVIDRNAGHVADAEAAGLLATQGNALDEDALSEANAAHVRYAVVLTPNAEVNALAAQLLRSVFIVPEVHVLNTGPDDADRKALLDHLGATILFDEPVDLADWDYLLTHAPVDVQTIEVDADGAWRAAIHDAHRHRLLPVAYRRGDDTAPFHGDLALEEGDTVLLLQAERTELQAMDRFDRMVTAAPVIDLKEKDTLGDAFVRASDALSRRLSTEAGPIARALLNREKRSSTVVASGIAIPHVEAPGYGRCELVLVRSTSGLSFPDHDDDPVHALFVLATSPDERTVHLRSLSAIAQIVANPGFADRWEQAPDAEALRTLLLSSDRRRMPDAERTPTGDAIA